jgi:hypothetical protein
VQQPIQQPLDVSTVRDLPVVTSATTIIESPQNSVLPVSSSTSVDKQLYTVGVDNEILHLTESQAQRLKNTLSEINNNSNYSDILTQDKLKQEPAGIQIELMEKIKPSNFTGILAVLIPSIYLWYLSNYGSLSPENTAEKIKGKKHTRNGKFLTNLIGPLIFGFLDNFGMMIGMEVVEVILKMNGLTDPTIVAMLGNTVSDGIGALAGSSVSGALVSHTAYDGDGNSLMELAGITLGCLLPPAMKYLTLNKKGGKKTGFYIALAYIIIMVMLIAYMFMTGKAVKMSATEKRKKFLNDFDSIKRRSDLTDKQVNAILSA